MRQNLLEFLEKGPAHATVKDALSEIKIENRHKRWDESLHTIWEELEHLRIAQEDILRFTLEPDWQSPDWPAAYWPSSNQAPSDDQWTSSLACFYSDLGEVTALVMNEKIDLSARIPHGQWRTYLREILLIIDHNAYHLGKIVQLRKLLGDWPD